MNAARVVAERGPTFYLEHYQEIRWLRAQYPPLASLAYGIAMQSLGEEEVFVPRLLSLTFALGTLGLMYAIGQEQYDGRTGLMAAALLAAVPFFMRLGTAALTDLPTAFFFLLGKSVSTCSLYAGHAMGWRLRRGVGSTAVCVPLILMLPGTRHFLPAVPALTIRRARGLEGAQHGRDRIVLPALAFGGGMLYLFVDWSRAAGGWCFLT